MLSQTTPHHHNTQCLSRRYQTSAMGQKQPVPTSSHSWQVSVGRATRRRDAPAPAFLAPAPPLHGYKMVPEAREQPEPGPASGALPSLLVPALLAPCLLWCISAAKKLKRKCPKAIFQETVGFPAKPEGLGVPKNVFGGGYCFECVHLIVVKLRGDSSLGHMHSNTGFSLDALAI